MRFGILCAVAASALAAPVNAAPTINFDDGTYSFQFQSTKYRVWRSGPLFTVATDLSGDIANGAVTGNEVQIAYQAPAQLINLASFDVMGTGSLFLQIFDHPADVITQPGTTYQLTGAWQTITVNPSVPGFLFRLTTTDGSRFSADNFVFGASVAPVPEPASWALMIAGFGLAGSVTRRRKWVLTSA
ncbi:PEPxxWA-CTERM sorting domain-containing protein [Sphingomonas tabacisoli]|uniref:PEPxxWA-CTERM sorting domain-containing protein n=1 Tax=Sphingomonas tabacisoli TaxID=2249466 RepID=A0ABW4HZ04_9SPHN